MNTEMREKMLQRLVQAKEQHSIWDIDPMHMPVGIRISPERLTRLRLALRNTQLLSSTKDTDNDD